MLSNTSIQSDTYITTIPSLQPFKCILSRPGMHYGPLGSEISKCIQGFPVAVIMRPVQHGEVKVQLNIDLIHQLSDFWSAHDGEQKAPFHGWSLRIPTETMITVNRMIHRKSNSPVRINIKLEYHKIILCH